MNNLRTFLIALSVGMIIGVSGSAAQQMAPQYVTDAVGVHFNPQSHKVLLWDWGYPGGAAVVVLGPNWKPSYFVVGCAVGTRETPSDSCKVSAEESAAAPMSETSVFNLASVGKLFTALILAHTTDMSLKDNPGTYITNLTGGCINSKTLGEIASRIFWFNRVSQSASLPRNSPQRRLQLR